MSENTTHYVLNVAIKPADHPKIEEWTKRLYMNKMTKNDLLAEIREIQKEKVKFGTILTCDVDTKQYNRFVFRASKICDPVVVDLGFKIKDDKKKETMKMADKVQLLKDFVAAAGHHPKEDDEIEGFKVGKFYKTIIRSRDRYREIIDCVLGDSVSEYTDDSNEEEESDQEVVEPKAEDPVEEKASIEEKVEEKASVEAKAEKPKSKKSKK